MVQFSGVVKHVPGSTSQRMNGGLYYVEVYVEDKVGLFSDSLESFVIRESGMRQKREV